MKPDATVAARLRADGWTDDGTSMGIDDGFELAGYGSDKLLKTALKTSGSERYQHPNVGFGRICPGVPDSPRNSHRGTGGDVECVVVTNKTNRAFQDNEVFVLVVMDMQRRATSRTRNHFQGGVASVRLLRGYPHREQLAWRHL